MDYSFFLQSLHVIKKYTCCKIIPKRTIYTYGEQIEHNAVIWNLSVSK